MDQLECAVDSGLVLREVQPAADARRMRQRHDVASPSSNRSPMRRQGSAKPRSRRIARPPTGDDQPRPKEPKLPLAPERAELLLAGRGRAVAAAAWGTARVAARDGGAIERRVELVLVHRQPAPQRLPGAPAPRPSLLSLDDPRRLPEDVRALAQVPLERPAATRSDTPPRRTRGNRGCRAAARRASGTTSAAASPGARTTTNQFPSKTTSPPPSSSASPDATKKRL